MPYVHPPYLRMELQLLIHLTRTGLAPTDRRLAPMSLFDFKYASSSESTGPLLFNIGVSIGFRVFHERFLKQSKEPSERAGLPRSWGFPQGATWGNAVSGGASGRIEISGESAFESRLTVFNDDIEGKQCAPEPPPISGHSEAKSDYISPKCEKENPPQ